MFLFSYFMDFDGHRPSLLIKAHKILYKPPEWNKFNSLAGHKRSTSFDNLTHHSTISQN